MNTYKSIKKVMLVGITATALLSGCGGSNEGKSNESQSNEVNAEKSSKEIAQEMYEAEKKSKEVEKELNALRESENSEFLIDFNIKIDGKKPQKLTFDLPNEEGNLSLDAFKSLKVGISPKKIAETLSKNVSNASFMRIKQYGKKWEGTMYTYEYEHNGIVTQIEVYFTHEDDELKLYGARRTEINRANESKQTTLDNKRGFIGQGADTEKEKDTPKNNRVADTTSEGVTKSTDKPAPSKADTPAKSAKSAIPNDYCGHGHDETKQEAHGCDKIIDEEAHQRHLRQQEEEYRKQKEAQQREEEANRKYDENGTVLLDDGTPALTEAEKARIQRQEKRWNTPSGGIGDKWQDEMKEMEEQEAKKGAQQ
ncbi:MULTISPECIES: hypothetical protein [Bacillus cereus group]|uniref:Lipoprotein n=1 Tax=Bacillus mycoides TaxID=1405 RepID=A0A1E8B776_BACMY|nr:MULTISPECIES: hypothetical protein [Bacillus cereus group]OFD78394.1 hypothetical protein BWGOE8_29040 [Bacillus mycoides]OFD78788.1 hypothetical protein BWGOE9_29270 [Bacillus mycoides]OFD80554.1 hypothetical protein BWGOE10_29060 [Bacillus mycoides]